jgi:hypothetical protein
MHLLRKTLIPLTAVAVIALAISVVGPRAVRAITTPPPSFSPTAVRYPFAVICEFADISVHAGLRIESCTGGVIPLPPGVEFVIETITRDFDASPAVDNVRLAVLAVAGGNGAEWTGYVTPLKSGGDSFFNGSAQTTLYSDPSATLPQVSLLPSEKTSINGSVFLIGYYVYPPAT